MRERLSCLCAVSLAALLLVGCAPSEQPPTSVEPLVGPPTPADSGRPIKVGVPAPLTGPYAHDGLIAQQAAIFAVEAINANGGLLGRQLEIVYYDVEDVMPEKVTASSEALVLGEGVNVVVTSWIDYGVDVHSYGRYEVPYFGGAATTLSLEAYQSNPDQYWNCFMYWAPEKNYSRQAWPQLMALPYEYPNRRVFIVQEDDQWSHFIADEFRLMAESDGWEVVGKEIVPTATVEWGGVLTKIRDTAPAIIEHISLSPAAEAAFLSQFLLSPTDSIIHMPYQPSSPEFLNLTGENSTGVIWSTTLAVLPGPEGEAFRRRFEARFGPDTWNVSYTTAIWDMLFFWSEAVVSVGDVTDYRAVADYLRSHDYKGYNGTYRFPPETNTVILRPDLIPAPMYQVQYGQHIQLFPVEYAAGEFIVPPWISVP